MGEAETQTAVSGHPAPAPRGEEAAGWTPPPAQPARTIAALAMLVAGVFLYAYVIVNFWSSSWLGIHLRTPYPAYALMIAGLLLTLAALRVALGIWSPHAKLGVSLFAFLACAVIAVGFGKFRTYTMTVTRNPPFTLKLGAGDNFPAFALPDQHGNAVDSRTALSANPLTLITVYRGDFCPFARAELRELGERRADFDRAHVGLIAISIDAMEHTRLLADFLTSPMPLLSDAKEQVLRPLGLIQTHRNGEPDNAIPAWFLVDRSGKVRWLFTSPFYREQAAPDVILSRAAALDASE